VSGLPCNLQTHLGEIKVRPLAFSLQKPTWTKLVAVEELCFDPRVKHVDALVEHILSAR
jgi:hypothetical protein